MTGHRNERTARLHSDLFPDSDTLLEAGRQILQPLMSDTGFRWVFGGRERRPLGKTVWGYYVKGARRIELTFCSKLNRVTYTMGRLRRRRLDHGVYMHCLGVHAHSEYAWSAQMEPLDGFRCLRIDLLRYCMDFLEGSGSQFKTFAKRLNANPGLFKGLPADAAKR